MTINGVKLDPVVPVQSPRQLNVSVGTFANEYDQYFRPGYDQNFNRAANQPWLETWGHGLISRTASILPKVGQGFASILGAGQALGSGDLSDIWDNSLMRMFDDMDESLKQAFPVYKSRAYAESGLLGKMATASFWADDAFDGIAYAASAFVPGKGLGALTQGVGKALNLTKAGKNVLSGLRAVGLNQHRTNLLAATAYNTIAEASVEAFQIQKELELQYEQMGLSPKEAKAKAAEAAGRTFRANASILGVPNLIQNMFFHGSWNKNLEDIRRKVFEASGDIAKVQAKDSILKNVGLAIASEGFWEENAQTSVQQAERYLANYANTDKSWEELSGSNFVDNIQGFFKSFLPFVDESPEEIEGATSIFLGALVGGSVAATGTSYQNKQKQKAIGQEKTRYDALVTGEIGKAATNLMVQNVGSIHQNNGKKTIDVDGKPVEVTSYELDENGKAKLDPKAIKNLYINGLKDKALWDGYMLALLKNDPLTAEIVKQQALASFAYALSASPYDYSADEVSHFLDKLGTIGSEEASQLGISSIVQENMQTVKDYYSQIKQDAAKKGSISVDVNDPVKSQFNTHLVKTQAYLKAKKKALESMLPTTEQGVEGINALLTDTNEYLRIIDQEASKLEKLYKETVFDPKLAQQEIVALSRKKDRSAEEEEKLKKLLYFRDEDIYINGNWRDTGASRTLPGGAEVGQLTRINPGSKDLTANALGTTYSNLTRVEAEMADPKASPITLGTMLVNGIFTTKGIEDRLENLTTALAPKVNQVLDEYNQHIESLKTRQQLVTELSSFPEEPTPLVFFLADLLGLPEELDTEEQIITDPTIQAVYKWLEDNNVEVSPDTIFDEDFISRNAEALSALNDSLTTDIQDKLNRQSQLNQVAEHLSTNTFPKAIELEERLSILIPKANETLDGNLKLDYFSDAIESTIKSTIKLFNTDKDGFEDDQSVDLHIARLEEAIAAYSNVDEYYARRIVETSQKYLDFIKGTIVPKLLENINNRAKAHIIYNNDIVHAALKSLGITSKTSEIRSILEDIFGEELKTIIARTFEDQEILSFDALGNLLQQAIIKGTPEQAQQLLEEVRKIRTSTAEQFLNTLPERISKTSNNIKSTKGLEVRTLYSTNLLLDYYFADNLNDLVLKFISDGDMTSFSTLVKVSNDFNAEEKEFVAALKKVYDAMNALNLVENFLTLDPKVFTKLKAAKEALKDRVPSLQQNIVLTQLLNFLFNSKPKGENFDNWIVLRGIGGSGKTYLMSLLRNLFKDVHKTPNIYAFSSQQLASNNINNVIFGEERNSSLANFLNLSNEEISKLDYVVLDELYTFKDGEVELINAKLGDVVRSTKKLVKVVALGDPSQLSASENPIVDGSIGAKFTLPLTTSYRTNVSAISSFIRKYQLTSNQVENTLAVSNATPETIGEQSSGVVAVTTEQLEELLTTSSVRSRVLLVSSPRLKELYQGKNVLVKTTQEAQGYQ